MNRYDEVAVEALRRRGSVKWSVCAEDMLAAWVAETDFPVAEPVRAAIEAAVRREYFGYPPDDIDTGLPAAVAAWLAPRGLSVVPERIRLVPDVLRGIELAVGLYSAPGSAVALATPAYPPFFEVAKVCGRSVVEVPAGVEGGRWALDLAGIDAALGAGAGTVILCNPHNPLGTVFTRQELADLAAVVERHGARVVADEVHSPLVYSDAAYVPYASVSPAAAEHSVTLVSASKGWNLPGLKCASVVLTSQADASAWEELSKLQTHGASTLGIVGNLAAFTEGGSWLSETVAYLEGNRDLLAQMLAEQAPDVVFHPPQGTYLAWLDCRAYGLDDPAEHIATHGRVKINDGATFGQAGAGGVRLNFATSRAILEDIVTRVGKALSTR